MKTIHNITTIGFEQSGTGPAIVFIHDSQDNSAFKDARFADLVKSGFRVILTNLRGFARNSESTLEDLTGDAVALLNFLGIGRALVFGVGRGGCVLLNLLEKHPDRIFASSLVIPSEMAASLHNFTGRKGLLEALRTESSAALVHELFNSAALTAAPAINELPALRTWLDQISQRAQSSEKSGLGLLADLQLPLLLIDTPTPPDKRRWRQRLGKRLRAFNGSLLAFLDLLIPGEGDEFDDEVLRESH